MFSGYKQREAFTYDVLLSVERFVKEKEGREHIFDDLGAVDEGDLHRLGKWILDHVCISMVPTTPFSM